MVTPKQSQKIIGWCVESALIVLYDLIIIGKEKIGSSEIGKHLRDEFNDQNISGKKISKMTYDLKRSKYLEIGEGDSVILTDKAKIKLIDKCLTGHVDDGKKRLISFDIPEPKRVKRDGFRRVIKRMGFVQIQKSLWVCDRNLGELVEIAIKEFKVERYVAYFVVENSNIEKYIKKLLIKGRKHRK